MNSMHKHKTTMPIEDARLALSNQRLEDFLSSLDNPENVNAERVSLHQLIKKTIEQLAVLEKKRLGEFFEDDVEELCPGCLLKASMRVTNTKHLANLMNEVLTLEAN